MEKKRLHQVAKEFRISAEALIKILAGLGFPHKGYMSPVTPDMIEAVRHKFEEDKAHLKEEYERKRKFEPHPKVVKRKDSRGRWRKFRRPPIDQAKVVEKVKETFATFEHKEKKKKREKIFHPEEETVITKKIKLSEFSTVSELASAIGISSTEIIKKCMGLGFLATINQRLDMDTIMMVTDEFGFEVEPLEEIEVVERVGEVKEQKPPVVTVMGHVDHGKTSLLDYIRKTNVTARESGGITQHIGAYKILHQGKKITFLDTPGHEAFTAMRSRGAKVTDIVVLIVAADDGVMPQTIEAIDHAKEAGAPIVVVINKIDLPNSQPERVKKQLADRSVLAEDWGGKVLCVEISAKTGQGIPELLEAILLEAEMLELRAPRKGNSRGVVVESSISKGKGITATILVQKGMLKKGDPFVCGLESGRVRAIFDEWDKPFLHAFPSDPVVVLGFDGIPQVGDLFTVTRSEREAREISQKRKLLKEEQKLSTAKKITLSDFQKRLSEEGVKELKLILKGDVAGSIEALSDSIESLSTSDVKLTVIHKGVGTINESDVTLASVSDAIILGFHVGKDRNASELSEKEGVEIRLYDVIYEAISDVKRAMSGLLEPEYRENILGKVEVKKIFKIPEVGLVIGCLVTEGIVQKDAKVRINRDGTLIFEGKITSLKRFKEDVSEVKSGLECGIGIENCTDVEKDDVLEVYTVEEIKRDIEW